MTSCDVTVSVGNAQPVTVLVQQAPAVTMRVTTPPAVVASVGNVTNVTVPVTNATPVTVPVSNAQAVSMLVQELRSIIAEVNVSGLTGTLLDKLNSIAWGARNQPPDRVKLSYTSMKGTETGDYDPFPGTNSFREVNCWLVDHPAWRGEGVLEVRATASFIHTAGAGETVTFELQVADDFPTAPGTADVDYGMPQAWTTVCTVTTNALGASALEQTLKLRIDISSEGTTNDQFRQVYEGALVWTDPGATDGVVVKPLMGRIAIDTTKDLQMRLRFKTDYAIPGGDYFKVLSASAALDLPRDGHGY